MTQPQVTLVIPTRDRLNTLRAAIASATRNERADIEILVSDNGTDDEASRFVASLDDVRVRSVRPPEPLSMTDNWEFAFEHVRGRYAIYIGDDDAVYPGALDRLAETIAAQTTEYSAYWWRKPVYVWPFPPSPAYVESVPPGLAEGPLELLPLVRQVLRRGGWGHYALPTVYHGAVSVAALTRIKTSSGRVFHGTQPDVFVAFALPAVADVAYALHRPITLNGRSPKSNGGTAVAGSSSDAILRFIAEYRDYELHPALLPDLDRRLILLPDTILKAIDLFPERLARGPFGFSAMWALLCRESTSWRATLRVRDVVARAAEIRRHHPFSLAEFGAYLGMHGAAELRSRLRRIVGGSNGGGAPVPDDIAAYARQHPA